MQLGELVFTVLFVLLADCSLTVRTDETPDAKFAVQAYSRVPRSCKEVDSNSVKCDFNKTCVYGELNSVKCMVEEHVVCQGERSFNVTFPCLYCWQLPEESYSCFENNVTCKASTRFKTLCSVNSTTYCLGQRNFEKYKQCNTVTGHKWSISVVLSILFGGFGMDRFYLGHWQEGVGKLFSFGGFGVWTLIDAVLISIGYLKPGDSQTD